MPGWPASLIAIIQSLDSDIELGETLFFPEIRTCGDKRSKLLALHKEAARHFADQTPSFQVDRRRLGQPPAVRRIQLTIDPPLVNAAWHEPALLEFDVVHWAHGRDAVIGFVPALGIEVIAPTEPQLWKLLPDEIRHALQRSKYAASLYRLALVQRVEEIELVPIEIVAYINSPREREEALLAAAEKKTKPVIEQVGVTLDPTTVPRAYEVDETIAQLLDVLVGRNPRSILLVGPSGVGKTAALHELVRRQIPAMRHTPFWATNGSRLVAGMSGFGMWQERCQKLCREAGKAGAVLHLGNLVELMEVGRGEWVGQGIAGFLRPYLGRGDLIAVAECTPEQFPIIERQDPHLLEVFVQIKVDEPTADRSRAILRQFAAAAVTPPPAAAVRRQRGRPAEEPPKSPPPLTDDALDTLDRLHRRYASYSAYPGRPLRFLRNLIHDRGKNGGTEDLPTLSAADITAAFARETGLPLFMLDESVPLDLPASRQWFAERVIGQGQAVDLVADLLATVKAALNRPRRPIASLLFIGPTGVGKTEMAKALAEFFFGDRSRMTRFDMSEYASPAAVTRLVGGPGGSEGLLTAKVREQPFSVILLDEFEKADASFFDLLLQVLGDGRLTDASGRVADFSNAIVVMTSNLGAESYQQGGFGLSKSARQDARRHFVEAVRDFLRPEMFNRIDRIVPFLPLDESAVLQIVRRELMLLERRDGFRLRALEVQYAPAVAPHLARVGYDPLYGARPLKRTIERQVLAPLADGINGYSHKMRLVATVDVAADALHVGVRAQAEGSRQADTVGHGMWADLSRRCAAARREMQVLERSPATLAVRNEVFSLQKQRERRDVKKSRRMTFDPGLDRRLNRLAAIDDSVRRAAISVIDLEDRSLAALYEDASDDPAAVAAELNKHDFDGLLLELYGVRHPNPDEAHLGIVAGPMSALARLGGAYLDVAERLNTTVKLFWYEPRAIGTRRFEPEKPRAFLANPDARARALSLRLSGRGAAARFGPEAGLHHFIETDKKPEECLVEAPDSVEYEPFPTQPRAALISRRTYRIDQQVAEEKNPRREFRWTGRQMDEALAAAIEEKLHETLRGMLQP